MTCGNKNLSCLFWAGSPMNFVPGDAHSGFCRAWVRTRDVVQQCCPVCWPHWPFLTIAQSFSNRLTQKAVAGADEQQGTAVLRCARCCGVFEGAPQDVAWGLRTPLDASLLPPLRGSTLGPGAAAAPEAPLGCRVPPSHQHCLPEGFLRRPAHLPIPNPKPAPHTGFLFQFCFSLLFPLPRALGPLSPHPTPPHYSF